MKLKYWIAFLLQLALYFPAFLEDSPPPFNAGDPSPIPIDGGFSIFLILMVLGGIIG